jgi:PHP family Zn ribbon phosphoesterase
MTVVTLGLWMPIWLAQMVDRNTCRWRCATCGTRRVRIGISTHVVENTPSRQSETPVLVN